MEKKKTIKDSGGRRSWLVIALIVLVLMSFYRMNPDMAPVAEMTTVEFYGKLQSGAIKPPVVRVVDRDSGSTWLTGELVAAKGGDSAGREEDGQGKSKNPRYRVLLVPGENSKMMEDLRHRGIPVVIEERRSLLSPFVVQTIFFVGLLVFFFWMTSKKMGDGGMFGFAKSKAKVLNGREDKRKITFSDVAGIDEAKEEVQEIVEFLKRPDAFRKLGGRIPKGILLVGPPGTGKTLLAKAIAGEAEVPFFAISGSDFEEMFVGVGASRMRDMFAEAKKRSPCIVFIDEIDSIGQKRTGAGALGGSHAYEQTLNTMLVEMDGFDANEGVIVIAATSSRRTPICRASRAGRPAFPARISRTS